MGQTTPPGGADTKPGLLQRLTSRRTLPAKEQGQQRRDPVSYVLTGVVVTLYVGGLVAIVIYASAASGRHTQYVAVGLSAAFAATLTGSFFGFLVGIPRQVSLGSVRQEASESARAAVGDSSSTATRRAQADPEPGVPGEEPSPPPAAPQGSGESTSKRAALAGRFSQSKNLAEISDWLTKLLLGAGLVSLGSLGRKLGDLIDKVAGGLGSANPVTASERVMAGSILIAYALLGFVVAYVVTTSWYQRVLEAQ